MTVLIFISCKKAVEVKNEYQINPALIEAKKFLKTQIKQTEFEMLDWEDAPFYRKAGVTPDSIFVRSFNSKELQNVLEFYFLLVNKKEIPILLCHFDSETNLLVGLSGGASPRTEEFIIYLKRQ